MSKLQDVKVPDLGGSSDVPVIEVLVKDGDAIEKDAVLLVLESDKATMEVPAPAAGVVRGLVVKVGDKLSQGSLICQLEVEGAAAPAQSDAATSPVPPAAPKPSVPAPVAVAPTPPPQPAPASGAGSTATHRVTVPDLGSFKDVPVIEVLVADGASVEQDAPLLVLESDKSTMEVPAPAAGTVRGLKVKAGDKLNVGDFICELETVGAVPASVAPSLPSEGQGAGARAAAAAGQVQAHTPPPPQPSPASGGGSTAIVVPPADAAHAGPATRKFARELGVDLAQVKGSGAKGRVTIEDVQAHVKARMSAAPTATAAVVTGGSGIPPIPAQDFSQYGPIERKELARIRKLSAAHLSRSWLNIPHVTQFDEADITELEAFRKTASEDTGVKLTLLPFLMKAVATAMKQFPEFNSSLAPEGDALILKQYCHIGFAADTPNGLVVPVVKDVWSKGIVQLAQDCADLAKKARDGKLKPEEMRGGCFSISSLGGLGVSGGFTPIVNAPEVGILGVSKASMKPVWDGKAFQPRLMLPLSLSYDHRVIDGAYAARYTVALVKLLGDLRRLAL
ncbi:dihydrolipoyllysine-residue acetyltransferase [Stagnimonas aquatica]|uniref:Acetyltransferase component of pyruvate dehydrogenase complex n=1 Tax=Stagnimonas aquatica TaxID=2689987 RepID=A0A3N0VM57_9GAMM|nr:dihydrolipoyllysine-residue acetyltransferase [Stagnimonas aquatica]ROH93847.1 dihydrolipoyllysine-residue acetyltransferase [Stagnimonas aquatica]